jgi:hypothetical protein
MIENRYATLSQELVDTDCTVCRSFIVQQICIFILFVFWYHSQKYFAPLNPKMPQWAPKWAKAPSKFSVWEPPQKKKCPRIKFDFGPLNPKRPQWAPKMDKSPGVTFEFGRLSKRKNAPE